MERRKNIIPEIVAAVLVLLFSYTALSKFLSYDKFVFQMRLSPFYLLRQTAGWMGWMVPVIESFIVVLLVYPKTRLLGLWASLILLFIFEGYIFWMLLSGVHLPCTCGGVLALLSWKQHLLFNAVFMALTVLAVLKEEQQRMCSKNHSQFSRA